MENKPTLKEFYESTIPNEERVGAFYLATLKLYKNKKSFFELSNTASAFLAHLRVRSFQEFTSHSDKPFFLELLSGCQNLGIILNHLNKTTPLNETAIPIIEKYIHMFEAYEKQNGIKNPFIDD